MAYWQEASCCWNTARDSVASFIEFSSLGDFLLLNGNLFYSHTCAHILNLIVDGSLEQTLNIVNRVRELIQNVKLSQERLQKILGTTKLLQIDQRMLVLVFFWEKMLFMIHLTTGYALN
jgi:hypothetical protein